MCVSLSGADVCCCGDRANGRVPRAGQRQLPTSDSGAPRERGALEVRGDRAEHVVALADVDTAAGRIGARRQ